MVTPAGSANTGSNPFGIKPDPAARFSAAFRRETDGISLKPLIDGAGSLKEKALSSILNAITSFKARIHKSPATYKSKSVSNITSENQSQKLATKTTGFNPSQTKWDSFREHFGN